MVTAKVSPALVHLRESDLGAFFRPSQVEGAGVSYHDLQRLVAAGQVEQVSRGLYRLADAEPTENYSLAAVCARIPRAIICLLTALRVHGIGTQVSRAVWIAIPRATRTPREPGVSIRVVRFSAAALSYGVVHAEFEGVPARITSPTRTVLDCFRFERLVGREAAKEALRDGMRLKLVTVDGLFRALDILPSTRLRHVLEATEP
jgi:predicted transcriptional regulator of viral defense system